MDAPLIGTTTSTGVFISHSARVRAGDELQLQDGETEGRYLARKRFVGQLLDALVRAFDARGRGVWLDRREIATGEVFDRAICLALIRSSGAVVVVDNDALDSGWMREEAAMLGLMRQLVPDYPVKIALVGGVSEKRFATSRLGRTGGLNTLSCVHWPDRRKGSRNQEAAETLARRLADLFPAVPVEPAQASWVKDVAHFIRQAPAHILDEAARALHVSPAVPVLPQDKPALVAAALLGSTLEDAFNAVHILAEFLGPELTSVKNRVTPLWVDLDDARRVMDVSRNQPERRIVHLAAGNLPAYHAVQRGRAQRDGVQVSRFSGIGGEDMREQLLERCDRGLRAVLNLKPGQTAEDVPGRLVRSRRVVFAMLSCDEVDPRILQGVLGDLTARFPGVVFALVTQHPVTALRKLSSTTVRLSNGGQHERDTMALLEEIEGLGDVPGLVDH
ncbi:TIR domain-containing protein [Lentzea fradiae]|uniref:TIR domain-containing protein n=1 Tax=Lentzea fradiae TaxID=200378 RepID=A0A1G8C096_9PSEU|nr:toll/interleukin-1 receptor domain-containing protein [Lentzea fradiae]SDH38921.1 TIR domain-containing protein [Lentzea fradiae]